MGDIFIRILTDFECMTGYVIWRKKKRFSYITVKELKFFSFDFFKQVLYLLSIRFPDYVRLRSDSYGTLQA